MQFFSTFFPKHGNTEASGEMGQMFLSAEYATPPFCIVKNQRAKNESLPSLLSKGERNNGLFLFAPCRYPRPTKRKRWRLRQEVLGSKWGTEVGWNEGKVGGAQLFSESSFTRPALSKQGIVSGINWSQLSGAVIPQTWLIPTVAQASVHWPILPFSLPLHFFIPIPRSLPSVSRKPLICMTA